MSLARVNHYIIGAALASCCGCAPDLQISKLLEEQAALGSASVVVSQVYGGGGNSGATYTNDFIELFNRGATAVNLAGWAVQYASATGSSWSATNLSGTLQPGHYYLVQEAQGTGGTTPLPTPDAIGTLAMSATTGKVALTSSQTRLSCTTGCAAAAGVVDFVGFGSSASSYEGSGPTPTLDNTSAARRAGAGCTDTDNNAADFTKGAATPRNSATTPISCGGGAPDLGVPSDLRLASDLAQGIVLPSPTLPPATVSSLSFGVVGDTRPPTSTTAGYSQSLKGIIGAIFTGLQAQGVPLVVASGDYAFSTTSPGNALPQYNDYMTARGNFAGRFLPTMGNHECNGYTTSNCPVGAYTGMTQDYISTIVVPSTGQASSYYSALYLASDHSWSAKFIFISANGWDSAQQAWLQATLAVSTTYTFTIRHEPANDARAPGTTPSENQMAAAFGSGGLTLSLTGHTHLIQLPGGTQPYGDPYGATKAYEIIIGSGGAPLDAGPAYGYAVATRRASDGAIVVQAYQAADTSGAPIVPNQADTNFRFAVNANGSSNANTSLP